MMTAHMRSLGSAVPAHTPGPWAARQEFSNRWRIESHANGPDFVPVSVGLACTTILEVGCNDANTGANARLMAAAPDLLAALRGLLDVADHFFTVHGLNHEQLQKTRAADKAISLATGSQGPSGPVPTKEGQS